MTIGSATMACIRSATVSRAVNAVIPAALSGLAASKIRLAASASEYGETAAATEARSARRYTCGAPRTDHTVASSCGSTAAVIDSPHRQRPQPAVGTGVLSAYVKHGRRSVRQRSGVAVELLGVNPEGQHLRRADAAH